MENQQHFEDDQYRKTQEPGLKPNDGNKDILSLSALILGILSVLGLFRGNMASVLVSLILGITGLFVSSNAMKHQRTNMAQAGKILSIIGVVLAALAAIACIILGASGFSYGIHRMVNQTVMFPRMTLMHRFWL
ncbi:MAG: hypothetical protein PHU24_12150 [Sphaerochaetaceae bacterium]|jgi:hypothetical protein|nr:hypothetical protein [Sphaerochaetaceae bacterium]NLO60661.1 hypothetical protein [Spirochaetales bacterium]MDD2407194.1 hypothetical protein [Sphaerochaetaceae bacterium]MDD4259488.1 hypothetical protein [Sphaerochaetaceae bacterium]MDD4841201.1 hypothetical protein [Sphaerochaetaceae bacterium]